MASQFPSIDPTPSTSGQPPKSNLKTSTDSSSSDSDPETDVDPEFQATENFIITQMTTELKQKTNEPSKPTSKSKRTVRRPPSKIPSHLKSLIGEANLRVARGDYDTAVQLCFEVIRQCPTASEPYLTIAEICSEHQPQLSFECQNIAAHLRPGDAALWVRLAQKNMEQENFREAVVCYSKAIYSEPKNPELHMKRLELLESLGDTKSALKCKLRLAYILKRKDFHLIIKIAKEVAQEYINNKEYGKAVEAMNIPFKRCKRKVTPEIINMMLDALLLNGNYSRCLDVFVEYCDINIEIIIGENDKIGVVSYELPDNLLIDIFIRFIICLTKLETKDLVPSLIDQLLITGDAETIGDLFLDVAEACMSVNWPHEALKLLIPLVKSRNFSLPAVWKKHAESLHACGLIEPAIDSYYKVLEQAPLHNEVRMALAKLLQQQGNDKQALRILTQKSEEEELNVQLLLMKMELLKKAGKIEEYIKDAKLMLLRHCTKIKYPEEIKGILTLESPAEKLVRLKKIREFRGDTLDERPVFSTQNDLTVEEEYKMFREVLQLCKDHQLYYDLQEFAFLGLTSSKLKSHRDELFFLAFYSCLLSGDTPNGYILLRDILFKQRKSNVVWSLLNMLLQNANSWRYNRAFLRMLKLYREEPQHRAMLANYALVKGNCFHAMKLYMDFFRLDPGDFQAFLMGVCVLNLYCRRKMEEKERLIVVLHSCFRYYAEHRKGVKQEVNYNLGRLYQMLGINYLAVYFYEEALKCREEYFETNPELDLRREAAFNLHLIYKQSGNMAAARRVLFENIVV